MATRLMSTTVRLVVLSQVWGLLRSRRIVPAVDPELTGEETKRLYWGSQYERLSQIKARIDPQQLLNSAQGIVPANTSTECK